jgi:hypothetical protein
VRPSFAHYSCGHFSRTRHVNQLPNSSSLTINFSPRATIFATTPSVQDTDTSTQPTLISFSTNVPVVTPRSCPRATGDTHIHSATRGRADDDMPPPQRRKAQSMNIWSGRVIPIMIVGLSGYVMYIVTKTIGSMRISTTVLTI